VFEKGHGVSFLHKRDCRGILLWSKEDLQKRAASNNRRYISMGNSRSQVQKLDRPLGGKRQPSIGFALSVVLLKITKRLVVRRDA
jgi:hypothetical protein